MATVPILDPKVLKDKPSSPTLPKLRTSRNRIRIQDLRPALVSSSSRTSSPDEEVQQSVLNVHKVDQLESGMSTQFIAFEVVVDIRIYEASSRV